MQKNIFSDYMSPDFYVGKKLKWADGRGCIAETITACRSVPSSESTDFIFPKHGQNDPERAIRVKNDSLHKLKFGGFPNDPWPKAYFMIDGRATDVGFACLIS